MRFVAMATNGGAHSAEYMAEQTARQIIEVADHVKGERLTAARRLETTIIDILTPYHQTVLDGETAKLNEHGTDRLEHEFDASHHVDTKVIADEVEVAITATQFAPLAIHPEFRSGLLAVLERHFRTSMYMTRSWHADGVMDDPKAQAFRAQFHGSN